MATWQVRHSVTDQLQSEHGTKKAATETADEMSAAHARVEAKHQGQPVAFIVVKLDNPPPAEAVVEDTPSETATEDSSAEVVAEAVPDEESSA